MAVLALPAPAAVTYTAEVFGETRAATVTPVAGPSGGSYVSLRRLVRAFGGGVRRSDGTVVVDLAGKSARLRVDEDRVAIETEGGAQTYTLKHALWAEAEELRIAMSDVPPFFFKAFRLFLDRSEAVPDEGTTRAAELEPLEPESDALEPESDALEPESDAPRSAQAVESAELLAPMEAPAREGGTGADDMTEPSPDAPPLALEAPPGPELSPPEVTQAPIESAEPTEPMLAASSQAGAQTVVIDPGHGGYDTGSLGPERLEEKAVTLALAQEIGRILKEETDLTIYLTRQEDKELPAPKRVHLANEAEGDLLVSLHVGASHAPDARGYLVYVWAPPEGTRQGRYYQKSLGVAEDVAQGLADTMGDEWPAYAVHAAPLRLLGDLNMPAVLVETGFVTNAADARLLGEQRHRAAIARGVADGLKQALGLGAS
ncbi:MAG: N-acetylmuramoyl-L-alanine amidase [Candidatus Hydrogenedentota bacterium]